MKVRKRLKRGETARLFRSLPGALVRGRRVVDPLGRMAALQKRGADGVALLAVGGAVRSRSCAMRRR